MMDLFAYIQIFEGVIQMKKALTFEIITNREEII